MEYGCIAERLGHSFSREIHAALADYSYELMEVSPDGLETFLKEGKFKGINVTIPYKEAVMPYLYEIDEQAKAIGAVNTIVNRGGKLYGYNADFYGMTALLKHIGLDLAQKKVAILGTGGTSRTAVAVAHAEGAESVLRVSRTAKHDAISYEELYLRHSDTQIIINTTPCGMYPDPDGCAVDIARLPSLEGVADAVYNPLRPQLVLEAKRRGITAEGGLFMLVAQAVRASEIFLDTVYEKDVTERVFTKLLRQKENIVLIGMPGSGKSTVGELLSKKMQRPFFDMDALIVEAAGKPISQIFAEDGEAAFRDLETRVLKDTLAQKNGLVIATGGGAVLRRENVDAMRRNGRIYFLDRPLQELLPTADRPLASDVQSIRKRYEERYEIYCASADHRIAVDGDAYSVADVIGKDFEDL